MSTAAPPFRPDFRKGDRRPVEAGELARLFERLPPHALEAEAALLGSMIQDWRVSGEIVEIIQSEEDFYKPAHTAIYRAVIELYDQQQSLDIVQLTQKLKDQNVFDQIGGVEYLIELAESVPSATSAAHYARIVRDKAVLRRLIDAAGKIIYDAYHTAEPAADLLDQAEQAVFKLADTKNSDSASLLFDLATQVYKQIEDSDGRPLTGLETGFFELDEMTSGLQKGEMIIVAARPSMGKAQPLDAKVLTPAGWKAMGQLRIGDALASVDGQPSTVAGIYPQGLRQVYRITFADGRFTECCAEHLWRVHYRGWDAPRVIATEKLIAMLGRKRYVNRLWIETFGGEFGSDEGLPLDPWLLGCLIGDGSLAGSSVRFSTADEQMLARIRAIVGETITITAAGGWDYRLTQTGGAHRTGVAGVNPNPIKTALQTLGLWGCDATTKFIPRQYMTASRYSRMQLLAGLIDTDGWVEKWGSLRFATSSQTLARDVVELMRSLGGTGSYCRKNTSYTYQGVKRAGLPAYVCNLQHPDAASLVQLQHKRDRLIRGRQRQRRLNLVSIEPTRIVETQCIAVTHPSHLYITDDYIVTHNTAFALNMAEHMGATNKQPVAVFSLEMSKTQLAQRLMCSRSGIDSHKLRRNMLSGDEFQKLSLVVGELQDAPIYIDDTPGLTLLQLRAKARRLAARNHIKAVFIDYLQLMSQPGAESRQNEVSAISRGIKALARELDVPVVCLSQLNRAAADREGHRPRMNDLRESGSIEQDADVVLMLHREDYYHKGEDDYEITNTAEVIIEKQRNGPTGSIKLQFNGGTTRFNNLAPGMGGGGGGGY